MGELRVASASEVLAWAKLSSAIALLMLFGVLVSATLLPQSPYDGSSSALLGHYGDAFGRGFWSDVAQVFLRNLLVLLIHFFACLIGAIIGREHKPLPERWSKISSLHREIPKWAADMSLTYAFAVTLGSIALQTTSLGFILADLSAYSGLPPAELIALVLPHAFLELAAVFLPLALFLIQARRQDLSPLGSLCWQSLLFALPAIALAAVLEVSIAPQLVMNAIEANGGLPLSR